MTHSGGFEKPLKLEYMSRPDQTFHVPSAFLSVFGLGSHGGV